MVAKSIAHAVVLCGLAAAQNATDIFERAPPAVEQALRERVDKFYGFVGEGKYRAADALVAEEAKDAFFEADKRRCYKFSVSRINYSEQFSRAQVLISCEADVYVKPIGNRRLTIPQSSFWRIADGQWWWVPPPKEALSTPFGKMDGKKDDGARPLIERGPSVEELRKMFTADRTEIQLDPAKPSTTVVQLRNDMPGDLRLNFDGANFPDISVRLASDVIASKQTTDLTIVYTPSVSTPRKPGSVADVGVIGNPLSAFLKIRLSF
ncbi:MAG: hypothetical protein HY820_08970 [Acidobacteria bacterium]|nr:hypothetical protein [Acidobacteriota bacterium]